MKKPLHGLAAPPGTTEFIRIDQFEYLQNARKVAVVVSPQAGSNAGTPFNVSTAPNQYQVSYRFKIGDGVYNDVLKAAVRTFFYQRINFAKQPPYADPKWTDAATHEGPSQDRQATSRYAKGDMTTARDLHGGWMDAVDMNKYVTFAEEPIVLLLESYRLNPSVFGDNFNLPESGNGVTDVLDEAKWELDFLRRMPPARVGCF